MGLGMVWLGLAYLIICGFLEVADEVSLSYCLATQAMEKGSSDSRGFFLADRKV